MAGNKEKYGSQPFFELKSDNGVRILKFIPDDDLCVFTTVDANIAIYEPGAGGLYLLAMLNYKDFPDQRLPLSFHVSGEKRQLFFSDSKDNLMLINFDKTSQSFAPVQLKASASTSHISQVGEFLFYLNAQAGKVECMKRSGNTYVDDKEDVPPAASGAVPIRFVSVNNEALFIEFTDGTYGLYNVAKRQYMAQGILQKIPIHWDTPIKYDRNTMSLFFQSGNEICQFHITRKAIVRRYDLEKWGQPGNYLLYKQKIVFATDKHHMIGKILGEKEECDGNVYIAASRFKLDPKFNQVYFNVKDREQVLLTNGKLIEELRITPEKDKIEEIELNPKKNQGRNTQGSGEQYRNAGKGEARSRSQRSREEEEDEERDDQTMKKKTKKKKVVKKRKRSFDLNGIHHLNKGDYNALRDEHLKSYFYSYRIRHHLIKQHMITKDGYIIENPEEFRKNQKLFREHYKSTSVKKKGKKTAGQTNEVQNDEADQKRLKKEEFDDFLQNVKKEHQLNKSGGTQSGVDLDLVEAEIRRKEEERRVAHEKKRAEDEERRLALEKKSQQPAPKPVANPQPTIQNPPVQAQPKKVKPEEDF